MYKCMYTCIYDRDLQGEGAEAHRVGVRVRRESTLHALAENAERWCKVWG